MNEPIATHPKAAFSELQLSALAEAGNIGAGHAAVAMAQLVGRPIMVAVTKAHVLHVDECHRILGCAKSSEVGLESRVLGDIQGGILVLFEKKSALKLAAVLLNAPSGEAAAFGEMEQSALKEACSIVSASYLNALSDMMSLCIIPSVHRIIFDRTDALFARVFGRLRQESTMVIGVETEFLEAFSRITGYFFFMPDKKGVATLLERMGVKGK